MIARAPYLFLLLIIVPDLYFDLRYWRHKFSGSKRLLYWLPSIVLVGLTLKLTYEPEFIPKDTTLLYSYLLMIGLIAAPKWAYMLCSMAGMAISKFVRLFKHKHAKPKNYGNLVGALAVVLIWYIVLYGAFVGFQKLEVNHHTYSSPDIPIAFDGYKIVLFSDAHVGSYQKRNTDVLNAAIDSINAQKPDMIVFTGDLLNIQPSDLYPHFKALSNLKAKDGVFSILGNHDYAEYLGCDEAIKAANCKEIVSLEKQLGWTLLLNENRTITRDKDHIILAGMENDGDGVHFPQKGDINKTLENVKDSDFILMLEHDPSSWRRKIIPDGRAQLTLSGHTHAMQFNILGWCPMSLLGKEFWGWYEEGNQKLFVTAGLGGLIPFRFGATGEIVILTLKKK